MGIRYRKKPVVIEAIRYTGHYSSTVSMVESWGDPFFECSVINSSTGNLEIRTLEGTMDAHPGDWIIKGVKGEFYPCKPDIFEASYEEVVAAG